ncbi:hypothetical protein AK812_SmicGene35166 [Symbiodinium microadriaticum]|uniref:Ubiquitin-like domain-containing protein n=1 Tax=Symbiodinium microadriaticum TaxID=2951 RepID=A0A1Q9CM63_SYMMI|nr:hypothetical protein AK812_SmicGene35166 [Symbiodinium microadriaticum]
MLRAGRAGVQRWAPGNCQHRSKGPASAREAGLYLGVVSLFRGMQAGMQPVRDVEEHSRYAPPYNPDYDPWHEDSDESEFFYGEPSEFQRVQATLQNVVLDSAEGATEIGNALTRAQLPGLESMSIPALEAHIADRASELRMLVTQLEKLRSEEITLDLLLPSGRSFTHVVKMRSRISAICKSIRRREELKGLKDGEVKLVLGTLEMQGDKTVFDYGLADGDSLTVVLQAASEPSRWSQLWPPVRSGRP